MSEGLWYPGTATKSSAASLRWFRDTFGGDYPGIDMLAEGISAGSEGLIFHPYLNGELTPYGEPLLRASFTGVSSGHGKGHFCRAVLEGVALSMLDCLKTIDDIGMEHEDKAMIIGGGAQSRLWRQILADALGMVLIQPERSDSSLGAAMLAGVAVGVFKDYDQAVSECTAIASVTDPDPENGKIYAEMFGKYKAIQRALEPIYTGSAK